MNELEHFKNYASVVEAKLQGKEVQLNNGNGWVSYSDGCYVPTYSIELDYRIKPKGRRFKIAIYKSGYSIRTAIVQPSMYKAIETNPHFDYWLDEKEWEIEE